MSNEKFQKAGFLSYEGDVLLNQKKYKESALKHYKAYEKLLECDEPDKINKHKRTFLSNYINSKLLYYINIILPEVVKNMKNHKYDQVEQTIFEIFNDDDFKNSNQLNIFYDVLSKTYEKKSKLLYNHSIKSISEYNIIKSISLYMDSYILFLLSNEKKIKSKSKSYHSMLFKVFNKNNLKKFKYVDKINKINVNNIYDELKVMSSYTDKYKCIIDIKQINLFIEEYKKLTNSIFEIFYILGNYYENVWNYEKSIEIYDICNSILNIGNQKDKKNTEKISLGINRCHEKIFDGYISKAHKNVQIRQYNDALLDYKEAYSKLLNITDKKLLNDKKNVLNSILKHVIEQIEMKLRFLNDDKEKTELIETGINYSILLPDEKIRNKFESLLS